MEDINAENSIRSIAKSVFFKKWLLSKHPYPPNQDKKGKITKTKSGTIQIFPCVRVYVCTLTCPCRFGRIWCKIKETLFRVTCRINVSVPFVSNFPSHSLFEAKVTT